MYFMGNILVLHLWIDHVSHLILTQRQNLKVKNTHLNFLIRRINKYSSHYFLRRFFLFILTYMARSMRTAVFYYHHKTYTYVLYYRSCIRIYIKSFQNFNDCLWFSLHMLVYNIELDTTLEKKIHIIMNKT